MILFLATVPRDPMTWAIYALGAVTVIYVVIIRPMLRKKRDPLAKLPGIGLSQQRVVEREMQNLLVELSEMTRQISAQLDTRSTKLELLLQEADEKIAELKRLQAPRAEAAPAELPGRMSAPPATAPEPKLAELEELEETDDRYLRIYDLSDEGRSAGEIAREFGLPQGEVELILALRAK